MRFERSEAITLFVMVGGGGASSVEAAVTQARKAAGRDLLETLLGTGRMGRVILATDDPDWAAALADLPVETDLDPRDTSFHFGRRLADLIDRYQPECLLYAGGGSAPLMRPPDWEAALDRLAGPGPVLVTNNLHSSDWIALRSPASALHLIADQERDNGLGWTLARRGGFRAQSLPPSAASRFDLDTPADLLVAHIHPRIGPHLRATLDGLGWPSDVVEGVLAVMAQEAAHLTVIGRSSSTAWSALERATQCWVRLLAEERGMIASGRLARGEVRSLLNDYLEQVGAERFFSRLASLADAVLFDSRVILGARGLWPSAQDRFNADLLRWERVQEPFLRSFSRAAAGAGIPILMGGQSVVAGGLMGLIEVLRERRSE
ncbi:MAG: hypothetical protein PVI59_10350 [Anaerolineae bacterium]|jgi:hypothetical protein